MPSAGRERALSVAFAGGPPPGDVALASFGPSERGVRGGRRVLTLPTLAVLTPATLHDVGAMIAAEFHDSRRAAVDAGDLTPAEATAIAAGATLRGHRYSLRTHKDERPWRLSRVTLHVADPHAAQAAWDAITPGVDGALLAMRLAAEPPNRLTPDRFADRLAALRGVEVEVLKPAAMRREGFGALLGVARGSDRPARLVVLRRRGAFRARPLVLVGKGVTFDSGGVSIKPADGMEEMKADMAGAAAIAGCMQALAARDSPAPIVAVLGLVENMPGAAAQRPGDVVRATDGSTIEIIDTDAEGRLVLADCLAWTRRRFDPLAMIDLATLTGSIVVALGGKRAGLFSSDPALAAAIAAAGERVGEGVWPMPLDPAHAEPLKSDIADVRHCVPGRFQPDACHAAAFLHRFAGNTPWAHLDIAGMEWRSEADEPWPAGPTGFGARLLDRLVAMRFEDPDNWPDAGH